MNTVVAVSKAFDKAKEPAQIEELRGMFQLLMTHWMETGWGEGNNNMGWLNNGYDVRQWTITLIGMRDEMATPAQRDEFLKSVAWFLGDGREAGQAKPQYSSTDNIFNYHQNLAPLYLVLDDKHETVQRLKALRRVYEYFLLEAKSPGTNDSQIRIMGEDGTIVHHKMHNILYGSYSVPYVMRNSIDAMMKTETFRLSPAAHERVRQYVETNAIAAYKGDFEVNMNSPPKLVGSQGAVMARHLDTAVVAFLDGHVKAMHMQDLAKIGTPATLASVPRYSYFSPQSD